MDRFFSGTGKSYGLVAKLCTFGFDEIWKRKILSRIPQDSRRIMDQACGTGILTFKIAKRFPLARVTGVELRQEYLDFAVRNARRLRICNTDFYLGPAEDVVLDEPFDCITSSYLAKYADLRRLVRHGRGMLRDGGTLILHDFTFPDGPLFLSAWKLYFLLLQRLGSMVYPEWKTAFFELPGLIRDNDWVRELLRLLHENAFKDIRSDRLTFGSSTIVSATR